MSRDPLVFLEDIATSCEKILRFTEGLNADSVFEDDLRRDAVLFNLHVLGEATKKLPAEIRERYPDVPWRQIAGMRDVIAHAYFSLDTGILWSAISDDVPALLKRTRQILTLERERHEPG